MSFLYNLNHVELCFTLHDKRTILLLGQFPRGEVPSQTTDHARLHYTPCKPQINTYLSVVGKPCRNSAATMVKIVSAKSRHASISLVDSMTPFIESR